MQSNQFETVVIGSGRSKTGVARSETAVNAARRSGSAIDTSSKGATNQQKSGTDFARIAKLDREDAPLPPDTVAPSVGKAMQQARLALSLSQKDLAGKVNEKTTVVADYESGKALPNPQTLAKFERILQVKLRGAAAQIGTPLGPKGKDKDKDKQAK